MQTLNPRFASQQNWFSVQRGQIQIGRVQHPQTAAEARRRSVTGFRRYLNGLSSYHHFRLDDLLTVGGDYFGVHQVLGHVGNLRQLLRSSGGDISEK